MFRPRTTLFLLSAFALIGCRTPERPRMPVNDETGANEDCPGCVDAAYMLWNLQGARHEGDLHAVNTSEGGRPAQLTVVLVDFDWWQDLEATGGATYVDPYDYACYLTYTAGIQPGSTAPSALLDWDLVLEPLEDGCGGLDPDWIDPDLYTELPDLGIEMIGEALDAQMTQNLADAFASQDQDWTTEGEPFYFGLSSLVDGLDVYDEEGVSYQGHYGRAYAVDDELNIINEEGGGSLLTTEQISAGEDGWFEIFAWTFFSPYEQLD